MESARNYLRRETSAEHDALDQMIAAPLFFQTIVGLNAFLEASAYAHAAVEAAFERSPYAGPLYLPYQARRSVVAARAIGAAAPTPKLELAPPASEAAALGRLYVIEGSSLGARVLLRLAQRIEGAPPEALAYLSGAPFDAQTRWRSCLTALEERLPGVEERSEAVREARIVFDLFAEAMRESKATLK